jgi:hypothetical protein
VGGPSPSCLETLDYFLAKSMDTLGTMNDMRRAEGYPYQGRWQNSNAMSDERHREAAEVAESWNCMLMTPSESSSMTNGRTGAK